MAIEIKPPKAPLHATLQRAAMIVLTIGMAAAAALWALSPSDSSTARNAVSANGSPASSASYMTPREEYEIEKVGGKPAVYVARFDRWLSSLFHGKNLAGLTAVISLLLAFVCWRESRWQRHQYEFDLSEKSVTWQAVPNHPKIT
jgi:hypothetical protein